MGGAAARDPSTLLRVEEARRLVLEAMAPLDPQSVSVGDAGGLVTAEDVIASESLPRFDNSAMDGYAVRAEDTRDASTSSPVALRIAGETRAGSAPIIDVTEGAAVRIMTGAALPQSADAVIQVEETEEREGTVVISAPVREGRHVRPAGDDFAAGALLIPSGTELGAGELALAAAAGASPLKVRGAPKIAVLVTGDELVAPEMTPASGQVRDSNSVALKALVQEAGADVLSMRTVADDRDEVRDVLRRAADGSDLIVSSGGVAVGKYDFVKEVVAELGEITMWQVAMQPGRPVVLGWVGSTPMLGLPGNPVSIHVTFEQFVRPAIRKLRGCKSLLRPTIRATLTDTIEKPPGRLHFVRVRLSAADERWRATPTGRQGSHIQSSLVGCHGLARFDIEETVLEKGQEVVVEVWRLPEPTGEAW